MRELREKLVLILRRTSIRSLALYLSIATVLSLCVTFSKYIIGTSGADAARMIKMGEVFISENDEERSLTFTTDGTFEIFPGHNISKIPKFTFTGSEADCYAFVEMGLGSAWEQCSDDVYSYGIFKVGETNKVKANARVIFSIAKDTSAENVYAAAGWKYVKHISNENKYVFATHVEANNVMENREFFSRLAPSGDNSKYTINVKNTLTKEDIARITSLSTADTFDAADISFRFVVMQRKSSSQTPVQAWNSLNTNA